MFNSLIPRRTLWSFVVAGILLYAAFHLVGAAAYAEGTVDCSITCIPNSGTLPFTTIIQVTHNESYAAYGNRIINLKDGWME